MRSGDRKSSNKGFLQSLLESTAISDLDLYKIVSVLREDSDVQDILNREQASHLGLSMSDVRPYRIGVHQFVELPPGSVKLGLDEQDCRQPRRKAYDPNLQFFEKPGSEGVDERLGRVRFGDLRELSLLPGGALEVEGVGEENEDDAEV